MKNQPTLPFPLEGNTANRDTVRSLSTPVSQMYKVALSQIRIRPAFNARIQPKGVTDELWEKILMIPQLADGIYASNGPADAIIGDFYKVDDYFYVTDGERRTRALRHLMATGRETYPNGSAVDSVVVVLNPTNTTDLQRKLKIGTTQRKLDLTTMQWAYYYKSIKEEFKISNKEIGELLNVSRAKVDQYILATTLPQDVQDAIDKGDKNITNEIAALRKAKADADDALHEKTPTEEKHDRKKAEEREMSGDEDDFRQEDNSVTGVSSKRGPKEDKSSGAITYGKDAIYQNREDDARWKQFLHRFEILLDECLKITEGDTEKAQPKLIERLKMEYVLQIK